MAGDAHDRPRKTWLTLPWPEWCRWVQGKTVAKETEDVDYRQGFRLDRGSRATLLEFTDGCKSLLISNSEPDWSEATPGEGVMLPSVQVWDEVVWPRGRR